MSIQRKRCVQFEDIPEEHRPEWSKVKFELNEAALKEFEDSMRYHQRRGREVSREKEKGQINTPTGTGKTWVEKYIIVEDMLRKTKEGKTGIYVIGAHRLMLCTQLFNNVLDLSIKCGIRADMVYLGSERYDFNKLNEKYEGCGFNLADIDGERTTSSEEILMAVGEARAKGHHVIIVSTYHSFHRLFALGAIDIGIFDEAHTTTAKRFTENIDRVRCLIKRQYFFTATRKVEGDDGGQNNVEFYGDVLYEMSPREAIERGEIVPPRIHSIMLDDRDKINPSKIKSAQTAKTIMEAFEKSKEKLKQDSSEPGKIGNKMLCTLNGLEELHEIHEDECFREWCDAKKLKVFAFSSDKGEFANFIKCNRQKALEMMNNLGEEEDSLFFHYDILTEGIDLPSITTILVLRDLPVIKFLQNVGRATRLIKEDRRRLYSGDIKPREYGKMIKPYCLVAIPQYPGVDYERLKKMITTMRKEYKVPEENYARNDLAKGNVENFVSLSTDKEADPGNQYSLDHIFEDIYMEEYEQCFWEVSDKVKFVEETIEKIKED